MVRILVTGSTGFIGGVLAPKLVEQGHDVYLLKRYVAGRHTYEEKGKTLWGNLIDPQCLCRVMFEVQPEIVVHLAALSPVSLSWDMPYEVWLTNVHGTRNLVHAAQKVRVKQFIVAGTSEEYGEQDEFPICEDAPLRGLTPYSRTKIVMDRWLMRLHDKEGFPVTVMRPFNTYGRAHDVHFVVERILSQMLHGKDKVMLGNALPIRDFLYRDDHVEAYLKAIGNDLVDGERINLCTGRGVTIEELYRLAAKAADYGGYVEWQTQPPRYGDISKLVGDNTKAKRILGWSPKVRLEDGLEMTVEMLRNSEWRTVAPRQ